MTPRASPDDIILQTATKNFLQGKRPGALPVPNYLKDVLQMASLWPCPFGPNSHWLEKLWLQFP